MLTARGEREAGEHRGDEQQEAGVERDEVGERGAGAQAREAPAGAEQGGADYQWAIDAAAGREVERGEEGAAAAADVREAERGDEHRAADRIDEAEENIVGGFCAEIVETARERIYIVEPTGDWFDDPNLTDKKFPGNPTRSYRSRAPLRIVGEVETWEPHAPEVLAQMKANLAKLKAEGKDVIID